MHFYTTVSVQICDNVGEISDYIHIYSITTKQQPQLFQLYCCSKFGGTEAERNFEEAKWQKTQKRTGTGRERETEPITYGLSPHIHYY